MQKNIFVFTKRKKAVLVDFTAILIGIEAIMLLFQALTPLSFGWKEFLSVPIFFMIFYFLMLYVLKVHNIMWEYSGGKPFLFVMIAVFVATGVSYGLTVAIFGFSKWLTVLFAALFFCIYAELFVIKTFILELYVHKHKMKHRSDEPRGCANNTMIIGAGWTGTNLAKSFVNDHSVFKPVCFVDDSDEKQRQIIQGLPVAGKTKDIEKIANKYNINKVIFAIPSCDKTKKQQIIATCLKLRCDVKVVPPLQEMVNQFDANAIHTREVRIEDLLGREPMVFDSRQIHDCIRGKVVLVTGGGGSIGSELCRQIAKHEPKQLIILDIYENNAYDIQMELKRHYPDLNLEVTICSIADYERCKILFETFRPELVFHAAAHKHVPLMEHVPEEAVKNNVVGTWNLCKLAAEYQVKRFLLISTDKAVNPTNVMGASKRCCEMIVKYHAQTCPGTVYCAVRFGNVLGSNGSVIPLFRNQILEGGPITITHKDIIRYFMTIPEAVSLVLETGTLSKSGEIFVLDMGEPVKILDLALNMIRLMGLTPYKDIDIHFTGLRPGEKLYEELLIQGEGLTTTENKKIFVCKQIDVDEEDFLKQLGELIQLANENRPEEVVAKMHVMIPTYRTPEVQK